MPLPCQREVADIGHRCGWKVTALQRPPGSMRTLPGVATGLSARVMWWGVGVEQLGLWDRAPATGRASPIG